MQISILQNSINTKGQSFYTDFQLESNHILISYIIPLWTVYFLRILFLENVCLKTGYFLEIASAFPLIHFDKHIYEMLWEFVFRQYLQDVLHATAIFSSLIQVRTWASYLTYQWNGVNNNRRLALWQQLNMNLECKAIRTVSGPQQLPNEH